MREVVNIPATNLGPDLAVLDGPADSMAERAYRELRDRLVMLEIRPGSPINEDQLAASLGIGRTPVREALKRLAHERLVVAYPRRGTFATDVHITDLAGLSEVRALLESHAARLAAERSSPADRAVTAELLAELDRAAGERDERALIELDQRIHRHVYHCAHNPFLEETLNEYYVLTLRIWFLALDRVARLDDAVSEHRELLDAIRAGDGQRAEDAMRRHVAGFENAIRRVL